MTTLYNTENQDVMAIAALLGCKPDSGLVNRMNRLRSEHSAWGTIGDIYGAMLHDLQREHWAYLREDWQHSQDEDYREVCGRG